MLSKAEVDEIKRMYPQGMKIRLIEMQGEPQMPDGLEGKVKMVDDAGQIHVAWSNGSSLALNTQKDYFEAVITQEYADEIGADGYSKDAADAVKLAKSLME